MMRGVRLARIAGIEVRLDWSLLIIFALVTMSLGAGLFPRWHPAWSASTTWITAGSAAILLLFSVLLHELSHALVGRAQGIEVKRITLFVFGGMAHMEQEPDRWSAELWMTIVGPLTSLVLGIICLSLASVGIDTAGSPAVSPERVLQQLGPAHTLLLWLGPVNVILAVFNLIPAFPLDGGRVLRALLWAATGDFVRATRWAASGGQAFAWLLIAAGVAMALGMRVPLLGTGFAAGLWIALIGWFLHNAAFMSQRQLRIREALRGVPVSRVMSTDLVSVEPGTPVQVLIDDYLMARNQRCFPVVGERGFAGMVCLDDVRRVARADRSRTTAADIMTPVENLVTLRPEDSAFKGMTTLAERRINQAPVVDATGELRGFLSREGLLHWLSLEDSEPGDHDLYHGGHRAA